MKQTTMKSKYIISIIIPIYNTGNYLCRCLDSIIYQSVEGIEIILIDDGSPDNAGQICDEYASKYDNINVIHQTNAGLSAARNAGLTIANGEYVMFVDSDDYLLGGSLDAIITSILKTNELIDVLFLASCSDCDGILTENGDAFKEFSERIASRSEVLSYMRSRHKFYAAAWLKVCKREFLVRNSISFEVGILSEDIDYTLSVLRYATYFSALDQIVYAYRKRSGSISSSPSSKSLESLIWTFEKWQHPNDEGDYGAFVLDTLAKEYVIALFVYSRLAAADKNRLKNHLRSYARLLVYSDSNRCKLVRYSMSIIGFEATAYMLKTVRGAIKRVESVVVRTA